MEKKYTLPKEFATKWVEALRSGEYKQGHSDLYSDGNYCCLGVACAIAGVENKAIESWGLVVDNQIGEENVKMLPPLLHGDIDSNPFVHHVTDMNDLYKNNFPEIADWIELNVEFI